MKVAQLCLTLCDVMDYTVHGIFQARILEWVAFPSPGSLSNPGVKRSPALWADSLPAEPHSLLSPPPPYPQVPDSAGLGQSLNISNMFSGDAEAGFLGSSWRRNGVD